jgi:hypothetical protein
VRLAIGVAAACALAALAAVLLTGGDEAPRGAGIRVSSAQDVVAAQALASALAAYAVQAQTIETVEDARAHDVLLRRAEEAIRVTAGAPAIRRAADGLRSRATAARQAAQSGSGVAALQAYGREVQSTSARLQSLVASAISARSEARFERARAAIVGKLARIDPGRGGDVGADDPVPAG